jgi:hypothetical protein
MRQWCVWGGTGWCGCVEILGGEDGPFEYTSGTGVYGKKSHADLMCGVMASNKCRAGTAWLHQDGGMGNSIGSGRGIMRGDLPKGGSYRTSAE